MNGPRWSVAGSVEFLLVEDGRERVPPRMLFGDAPEAELSQAVADRVDAEGLISTPINCLLIRSGGSVAVVDAGAGRFAAMLGATAGGLAEALRREEIGREEVATVVITHAHPDHIGGLTVAGEPMFPSATHLIGASEWPFWSHPETRPRLPEFMAGMPAMVDGTLAPLERSGLLAPVEREAEVLAGVRMVPASGHTPGHAVVEIDSAGARAAFVADAVLHEIAFAHSDWTAATDADPGQAADTRRALLDRAAGEDALLLATHLERAGTVERTGGTFALRPAA